MVTESNKLDSDHENSPKSSLIERIKTLEDVVMEEKAKVMELGKKITIKEKQK